MEHLSNQDLLEEKILDSTNDEISIIPASEQYDKTFVFMGRKAKHYLNLLETIDN